MVGFVKADERYIEIWGNELPHREDGAWPR